MCRAVNMYAYLNVFVQRQQFVTSPMPMYAEYIKYTECILYCICITDTVSVCTVGTLPYTPSIEDSRLERSIVHLPRHLRLCQHHHPRHHHQHHLHHYLFVSVVSQCVLIALHCVSLSHCGISAKLSK